MMLLLVSTLLIQPDDKIQHALLFSKARNYSVPSKLLEKDGVPDIYHCSISPCKMYMALRYYYFNSSLDHVLILNLLNGNIEYHCSTYVPKSYSRCKSSCMFDEYSRLYYTLFGNINRYDCNIGVNRTICRNAVHVRGKIEILIASNNEILYLSTDDLRNEASKKNVGINQYNTQTGKLSEKKMQFPDAIQHTAMVFNNIIVTTTDKSNTTVTFYKYPQLNKSSDIEFSGVSYFTPAAPLKSGSFMLGFGDRGNIAIFDNIKNTKLISQTVVSSFRIVDMCAIRNRNTFVAHTSDDKLLLLEVDDESKLTSRSIFMPKSVKVISSMQQSLLCISSDLSIMYIYSFP